MMLYFSRPFISAFSLLQSAVDCILREEQAGFRKGHSCTEQSSTLRNILEQESRIPERHGY